MTTYDEGLRNSEEAASRTNSEFSATRPQFFANRVLRLAINSALAQEQGPDCLALLCVVAMTEDVLRYRRPVTFWNEQLLSQVGFAKWERLDKARRKAVAAGWLVYEPGGRHKVGRYRVTIPADLQDIKDAAVDESRYPVEGYQAGDQESLDLPQTDNYPEVEGNIKLESRRGSTGGTSLPVPIPKPLPPLRDVCVDSVHFDSRPTTDQEQAEDPGDGPIAAVAGDPVAGFLESWNSLPVGSGGVVRIQGLPPMLSPKDRSTFDQIWPTRSSAAIAAMERIKSGGLAWRKLPLSVREFLGSGIIDDLLADRAAAVERPKMRLTKAQLEYLEGRQRAAS